MLAQEHHVDSLGEKHAAFAQFIAQYGRSYASKDTVEERFNIFSLNYDKIKSHNTNATKTFEMGLNEFADMTVEELNSRYFSAKLKAPKRQQSAQPRLRQAKQLNNDIPKEIDWNAKGMVSPSVDQGGCGSCWAFTTAGTMESLFAIENPTLPLPSYSVQYLLECDNTNYGCDGGWMADSYLWTIDHGIVAT